MLLIPWPPSWLSSMSPSYSLKMPSFAFFMVLISYTSLQTCLCKHHAALLSLCCACLAKPNNGWPLESVFSLPAPEQKPSNLKSRISNTKCTLNIAQKSYNYFSSETFPVLKNVYFIPSLPSNILPQNLFFSWHHLFFMEKIQFSDRNSSYFLTFLQLCPSCNSCCKLMSLSLKTNF